jgi:ABC-type transport system involved in multi-copper enzyme maturation permease subunit
MLYLVAIVADTAGVLLALLWTAGFLPTFLEPQAATVLLAKPAPRWVVLLGKYLGVVLFVGLFAALFVGGTWTALGARTGVWVGAYWLAVPLLMLNFAVFYAVSAFLAVWTRSTVASAFGVLLFWLVCWGTDFTHLRLAAFPPEGLSPFARFTLDAAYWVLPKPLALGGIFYDAVGAEGFAAQLPELKLVQEAGRSYPLLAVLTGVGFAAGTLGLAAYEFETQDY